MKLAIGSGHAGFEMKREFSSCLRGSGHDFAAFVNAAFTNKERHLRRLNKCERLRRNRSTTA
jgi:ribose 5-phosphate isomerase RpiB